MKPMIYDESRGTEVLHSGKYQGYDYVILSLGRHPTAYVRVPRGHRYFGTGYNDIEVEVHGGLTYASESVQLTDRRGWWVGWDYAHYGDYSPYDTTPGNKRWTTEEVYEDVKSVIRQLKRVPVVDRYRIKYSLNGEDQERIVEDLELATKITTSMDILGLGYSLEKID